MDLNMDIWLSKIHWLIYLGEYIYSPYEKLLLERDAGNLCIWFYPSTIKEKFHIRSMCFFIIFEYYDQYAFWKKEHFIQ